ncbi:MAG: hypothetical protein K2O13_03255, partial [Lachnospiraceae bacterium]|nr:hypothetical protein [Lachnospiraceae bacterium]
IIINMIASIRSLSDTEDGGIIFWKSLLVRKPEWLQEKMLQCDNFIKSLFIFELEIQLLLKYLQAIKVNNLFDENKVNATIDVVCHLYESVHFFKGKVLFSIKRKREIGLESWKKMVGSVGEDLNSYCSKAMDMFIS